MFDKDNIRAIKRWARARSRTASVSEAQAFGRVAMLCEWAAKRLPLEDDRDCQGCHWGYHNGYRLYWCEEPTATGDRRDLPHEPEDVCGKFKRPE